MGRLILDQIVQRLNDNGIRAQAAYPPEFINRITSPVAALSIDEVDGKQHTVTLLVEILGPRTNGGRSTQIRALQAVEVLEEEGAVCRQGGCKFVSKSNVFRVPIWATFQGIARAEDMITFSGYQIMAGTIFMNHACGFTSWQELEDVEESLLNAPWKFQVEEFFPWGEEDTMEAAEPFNLEVRSNSGVETYLDSKWVGRKRIVEKRGIRQIREGLANNRTMGQT